MNSVVERGLRLFACEEIRKRHRRAVIRDTHRTFRQAFERGFQGLRIGLLRFSQRGGGFRSVEFEAETVPFAELHFVRAEYNGCLAGADEDGGAGLPTDVEGGAGGVEVGGFEELEVRDEFAIGDFGFAPQRRGFLAVGGFEFEIPVGRFPAGLGSCSHFPPTEIEAVVEMLPALIQRGGVGGGGTGGGEFFDADIAEFDGCAFGFEGEVAFAPEAFITAADDLAIHRQRERAVVAGDAVVVPFGRGLAAFFAGKAALAVVVAMRLHGATVDGEDISMCGEPARLRGIGVLHVALVQHLHLDAAQEGHAGS